jgi:hypothetical protein
MFFCLEVVIVKFLVSCVKKLAILWSAENFFFNEDFLIHQSYISIFYGLQANQVLGNIPFESSFPILPKVS